MSADSGPLVAAADPEGGGAIASPKGEKNERKGGKRGRGEKREKREGKEVREERRKRTKKEEKREEVVKGECERVIRKIKKKISYSL